MAPPDDPGPGDDDGTPPGGRPGSDIDRYIADLIAGSLSGDPDQSQSAPIIIPDRSSLAVRLVSENSLARLKDAESDRALIDSALWTALGAEIGFFTNVVTGDQPISDVGAIFAIMLAVIVLSLILVRIRAGRRLREAGRSVGRD